MKNYPYYTYKHILSCIDGEKEPPKWLHRSHRMGHVLYLGSALASFEVLHHTVTYGLCCIELLTFLVGTSWPEIDDIDPPNG